MLSSYDNKYGAAIATYRLHRGLIDLGLESRLFCQNKITDDFTVVGPETKPGKMMGLIRPALDMSLVKTKPLLKNFSPGWVSSGIVNKINRIEPDIVHLHWICGGFLSIKDISKIKSRIVWTFHDAWPFTGGCHFPFTCKGFEDNCGNCLYFTKKRRNDISCKILKKKKTFWSNLPVSIVTPSHWLSDMARKSSIFRDKQIKVIPNGIDSDIFKPVPQRTARTILNLPQNEKVILFGSVSPNSDIRKGFQILKKSLKIIRSDGLLDCNIAIFGASPPERSLDLGFPTHYLGRLDDVFSLVLAYSAADVFVAPSIQDNLPNTVMESLSCGTPCVAFNIGGMSEMIQHEENGYLAKPYDHFDLARGIDWVLSKSYEPCALRENSRRMVLAKFKIEDIAKRYIEVYCG